MSIIRIQRILWPTDLSELSLKAAQYARAMCEAFHARLHVINVAPVLVLSDSSVAVATGGDMLVTETDTIGPARRRLREIIGEQFGGGEGIESGVILGNAWVEICRYAKEREIDLIVIATHGTTGLERLLMGSVAERVVRHATCPVLTVKSFERDFVS